MKRPRRSHSAVFKAKVALAAIRDDRTLVELSAHFKVYPNQITQRKTQLLERVAGVFGGERPAPDATATIRALQAKIAQLTMECDFLEGALSTAGLGSAKR